MKKEPNIIQMPMQPGDVNNTFANISKANKLFKYNPKTDIADGINKYVLNQCYCTKSR